MHSRLQGARPTLGLQRLLLGSLVFLVGALGGLNPARGQYESVSARQLKRQCGVRVVPSDVIEQAIREQARLDYDITTTSNQGRFTAALLFALADRQRRRRPEAGPFLIRQKDLFAAFLRVTGLSPAEVPPTYRKTSEVGLVIVVEHRRNRVIGQVEEGPEPQQALAVRATWPNTDDLPSSYAYKDTTSDPDVRVRRQRNTTYRLLKYADFVVYDEMKGVAAQPTSGALGALFAAIGMADVRETRFVVASDGTQVTLTRVDKVFSFEAIATVTDSGRVRRGIPEDRPRLEEFREVLEQDLEVTYAGNPPPVCPAEPDWTGRAQK